MIKVTENKTCDILTPFPTKRRLGIAISEPNEELINFNNVTPKFKKEFMEAWNKFYKAELNSTDNAGINQLSVLDEMGYYLNKNQLIVKEDTFEEAYEKTIEAMSTK